MTDQLRTSALTRTVMREYYQSCRDGAARGRKVAWATAIMPTELLVAADIDAVFPENHSATCGTKGLGSQLCGLAESAGLSQEVCSYVRCDLGVRLGGPSPWGGLARPDVLFCSTASCGTVAKWFQDVARTFGCELFVVDMPYNFSGDITAHAVTYIVRQLEGVIATIERVTGRPYDRERLRHVLELSRVAHDYWRKCLELGAMKPSPISTTDMLINMGPIVCLRGTEAAVEVYRTLYDELRERVVAGHVAAGEERYRLLWDNIPFWFALGSLVRKLSELGGAIVGATYLYHWVRNIDPAEPLVSLAREFSTAVTMNMSVGHKIDKISRMVRTYQADGLIIHSNRSCKPDALGILDLARGVQANTGIPALILEGDHTDARAFSSAVVETRLEAFIESLERASASRRAAV